jgi:hypothetical protein
MKIIFSAFFALLFSLIAQASYASTSQADYDRLKPQGAQGPMSAT